MALVRDGGDGVKELIRAGKPKLKVGLSHLLVAHHYAAHHVVRARRNKVGSPGKAEGKVALGVQSRVKSPEFVLGTLDTDAVPSISRAEAASIRVKGKVEVASLYVANNLVLGKLGKRSPRLVANGLWLIHILHNSLQGVTRVKVYLTDAAENKGGSVGAKSVAEALELDKTRAGDLVNGISNGRVAGIGGTLSSSSFHFCDRYSLCE